MTMGLRAKNRRLKQEALIAAATRLFEEKGFDATQMEEVAAMAGTATATAYNYFDSKNKLLTTIMLRQLRLNLPARRRLLNDLPEHPVEGIIAFERLLAQQTLRLLGKRAWRAVFRAGYDNEDSGLKRIGKTLSWIISLHYRRMFEIYRQRGRLAPDVDVSLAAELTVIAGTAYFSRFLMHDEMTVEELLEFIPSYAKVILSPWTIAEASHPTGGAG
ncbi:TetR/AcrR family transcriptional regulator [Paenirhodobacter populi]|uniref:TetR/AcrR family transcriptional regulator n=1 Tax=Paenirhodobacter populi TaxID=2306993 RepID=A0A443IRU8_9RHOB|nr:TetR/AcrR family transcriptional regulator [Sinirhodobacter populi]RWR09221.1 TetR/AcrR family transcriptional regulator [Sinirhodobacter populi]